MHSQIQYAEELSAKKMGASTTIYRGDRPGRYENECKKLVRLKLTYFAST
jgi:hypothetical protein